MLDCPPDLVNFRQLRLLVTAVRVLQGTVPENQDGMLQYAWWLLINPRMEIQ